MIHKNIYSNAHILHLRTLTLIHRCKIANEVIQISVQLYMSFINFVVMFHLAKNGLKPVQRQHCKWYNILLTCNL